MPENVTAKPRNSPKRDHLLDTAFRLFYQDGYHAVGIDTILAEAKVAKMTLYNHFKSKDELIVAVLQRHRIAFTSKRDAILQDSKRSPLQKLDALFDMFTEWFNSEDFNGCINIRAVAEYPAPSSPINQTVKAAKQSTIDALETLCQELGANHPAELAKQLFLLTEGAIVHAHTFNDPTAALNAKTAALALANASTS